MSGTESKVISAPHWLGWIPLVILPIVAIALRPLFVPWIFMWTLAFGIWLGFKWLTWWRASESGVKSSTSATLAYFFIWPGMDAETFLSLGAPAHQPSIRAWLLAAGKTILGVVLFWAVPKLIPSEYPLLIGWSGLLGLIFLLHFGTFHLMALALQSSGMNAQPIMKAPILSTSLGEFWSHRWNLAFRQLAHTLLFKPFQRRFGALNSMLLAFIVSGLIHDLVISLPAGAGFGLPTMYFAIQASGMAIERSSIGRTIGLGQGWPGWLFTMATTAIPAFWLFHSPFVERIVLPMMSALGAINQ